MAYDNTNSGILTRNDRKTMPKHPDYRGSINVGGVEYWLSAWIKKGERGKLMGQTFMSLAVQPKEQQRAPEQHNPPPARQDKPPAEDTEDNDVPF